MKPYTHPRDAEFAGVKGTQVRKMGKQKREPAPWKVAAAAKLAPHELDGLAETPIRRQIEGEIKAAGLPYLTFEDADLLWLKNLAPRDFHAARILAAIKDLPDFTVWRPAPGHPYAYSLPLELKRGGGQGRPGQRRLSAAAGGTIACGYTEAHAALERFLVAPLPVNPDTERKT